MSERRQVISLVRLNARLLAAVLIAFELLIVAAMMAFVLLPLARRSADDLAGLMLLSAQTWSELPPETRESFEEALINTHWLALRSELPSDPDEHWHGVYIHFLEEALAAKTGRFQHLVRSTQGEETWFWAALPSGGRSLAVGLPAERIGTHPVLAILFALVAALALAVYAAIWLSRRIARPLKALEVAVSDVGRGRLPAVESTQWPRELASLADETNRMAQQVRDALTARTTLLAGISHDLRTPLARMRLALALLEDAPDARQIEQLDRGIEAMDQLIGNVLDLVRGLEKEPLRLLHFADTLADIAVVVPEGRLVLAIDAPLEDLEIELPELAFRRIVGNFLGNALRYAPAGEIELRADSMPAGIRVTVLDRGPGIPPEQLDAVFQPFHLVESSRSSSTGGSGLGLAIVRQLAERQGWTVDLKNREGGGLAACLLIPAIPL